MLSPLFLSPLFVLALKIVLMTDKLLQPVKSEIFTLVGHTYLPLTIISTIVMMRG